MLMLGVRVGLGTIPTIINLLISLWEFMIVIRVIMGWLVRFGIISENGFSSFLYRATEPVLAPLRNFIAEKIGLTSLDISPAVAVGLCILLKWLVALIF